MATNYQPVKPGIVTNDGPLVPGLPDIKFEAGGAVLQSKVKRSDGILRGVEAGATMSEK